MNLSAITWHVSNVGFAGHSTWSSLAISPSGQVTVAYYSSGEGAIKFAALNASGNWDISTVENVPGADAAPHLRYRFSQAAIVYCVGFEELRYALNRGGVQPWTISTAAPGGGYGNSLAIGPLHHPWVSYALKNRGGLNYAKSDTNASTWVGGPIDGNGGHFNSLAFAPDGHPAVAYDATDGNDSIIKYAAFDGSRWHSETVGAGDGWCTLAFSPGGDPAIAFGSTPPAVSFAVKTGGAWNMQTVAAGGEGPSMAFTRDGEPAISYYNGSAMVFAVLSGGVWNTAIVERAGKDSTGQFTGPYTLSSLAFGAATGAPAFSYYDRATGNIKCAVGAFPVRVVPPIIIEDILR